MGKNQKMNPAFVKAELTGLATGLQKDPPGGATTLIVNGVQTSVAALVAQLLGYAALYQAVDDAEAQGKVAIKARNAQAAAAMQCAQFVKQAVKGVMGRSNPQLSLFGLTPDKTPAPLTAAQEVAKIAKAKATRVARHTMGSKQKAAITGATAVAAPAAGAGAKSQ